MVNEYEFSQWISLQSPSEVCPNTSIEFYLGFYGSAEWIEWDFGDGTIDTLRENFNWNDHTYTSTGTYEVSVKIMSYCGTDTTISKMVDIPNDALLPMYRV